MDKDALDKAIAAYAAATALKKLSESIRTAASGLVHEAGWGAGTEQFKTEAVRLHAAAVDTELRAVRDWEDAGRAIRDLLDAE